MSWCGSAANRSAVLVASRTRASSSPASRPPKGSSWLRWTAHDQEAVEEAVGELGAGDEAQQLVFGDVADDRNVRVSGADRGVLGDRLECLAVPGVADDRRQRVALAREDLENLRELGLEGQALVA